MFWTPWFEEYGEMCLLLAPAVCGRGRVCFASASMEKRTLRLGLPDCGRLFLRPNLFLPSFGRLGFNVRRMLARFAFTALQFSSFSTLLSTTAEAMVARHTHTDGKNEATDDGASGALTAPVAWPPP